MIVETKLPRYSQQVADFSKIKLRSQHPASERMSKRDAKGWIAFFDLIAMRRSDNEWDQSINHRIEGDKPICLKLPFDLRSIASVAFELLCYSPRNGDVSNE
jgi:hypothetical protein